MVAAKKRVSGNWRNANVGGSNINAVIKSRNVRWSTKRTEKRVFLRTLNLVPKSKKRGNLMTKSKYTGLLTGVALTCLASSALAQDQTSEGAAATSDSVQMDEIVITAEKRESSIQKTALSITALAGADLAKKGIGSVEGIVGQIAGVAVNNESGTTKVNIRGLGLSSFGPAVEGSVAVYAGGVYLAHANEIGGAFIDVQRLEVLRGPQGTLYGRNSTGGAVNIIPNAPTEEFHAGGSVSYGNYNSFELNGFVSGAVIPDVLKVRFGGQYQRHGGYSLNVPTGEHFDSLNQGGFRGTMEYTPTDRLKITLAGDYYHGEDTSVTVHYIGDGIQRRFADQLVPKAVNPTAAAAAAALITTVRPLGVTAYGGITNPVDSNSMAIDPQNLYQNNRPDSTRTYYGFSGILDYEISDDLSFKSITAYRNGQYSNYLDLDRTTGDAVNYDQFENWRQFSQELQLIGETGKLSYILGAYYLNDRVPYAGYVFETPPFGTFLPYGAAKTNAYAAFAQATYAFTPELKLTVGGRYGYERRFRSEFVDNYGALQGPILPDRVSFSKFTPKATLDYQPSNDVTLYATVAQGFKSGGFLISAAQGPIEPETVWDYEAGAKLRLFNNHVQLNVSGYHYDYKNIQTPIVNGFVIAVANAASATVDGGEVELTVQPVRDLKLTASGSLIDGKFGEFITQNPQYTSLGLLNLKGNRLPFNSKWSYYLDAVYTIHLPDGASIEPQVSYTWRGLKYFDAFNLRNNFQKAVGTIDARLRYSSPGQKWYLEGFGKNLTNEFVISQGYASGVYQGSPIGAQREAPRTYGVRLGFNY